MSTKELGDLGEKIACEYLVKKGYKILARNYRISFGEIDIIAVKKLSISSILAKRPIHFVEVKTIISNDGFYPESPEGFFPEEKVNYKKQRKLMRLAEIWLEKNKFPQNYPYQIDVTGILIDQNSQKSKLNYFPNVVEENY